MSDRPGGIAMLTKHIAAAGASIKDIIHERSWLYHSVDQVGGRAWLGHIRIWMIGRFVGI